MTLNFTVSGQKLVYLGVHKIVSDTINYIGAKFTFNTSDWEGVSKWVHFSKDGTEQFDPINLDYNDSIPETYGLNLTAGHWDVWVHGDIAEEVPSTVVNRITTGAIGFDVAYFSGGTAPLPIITPTVAEQIDAKATRAEKAKITDASVTVNASVGTPSASVSIGGVDYARSLDFVFSNLKGRGITSIVFGSDNIMTITLDDGEVITYNAIATAITSMETLEDTVEASEAARAVAESGRASAETNRVNAETARATAESARVVSESLRVTEELARQSAETSRETAESLRVSAETGRVNAETGRVNSEEIRAAAETGRVNAETARVAAETSRETAETARETAETNRANAESNRVTAETNRASAETGRVNAEASRVNAETSRVNAENNRANAETSRVNAETGRVNAEAARVLAETGRVNAETSRVNVEASRVNAETGRVNAETGRVTAEAERVTEFASMRARADTYVANEIVFIYGDTVYENEILYM